MPGKNNSTNLDPAGTDEHADDVSSVGDESSPYNDALAAMFGQDSDEDQDDDNADAEDEDEESDADAEEDADSDEEESDDDSDSEDDDGEDEDSDDDDDSDEDEDDGDEDDSDDETKADDKKWKEKLKKLPPEAQHIINGQRKALVKVRAKRNELKDQIATLTSERDEYKEAAETSQRQPVRIDSASDPLGHLTTEEDVNEYVTSAERTIEWCEDNEDGGEAPDGKGGTRELTREEVRQIKRNAEAAVNRHGPRRIEWLKSYAKKTDEARAAYPQLFRAGEERKRAEELLKQFPELLRNPDHAMMIGDLIIGQSVRNKKLVIVKAGKKAPATEEPDKKKKAPPASLASSSAPAARPKNKTKGKDSTQIFKDFRSGKGDPLAVLLAGSAKRE